MARDVLNFIKDTKSIYLRNSMKLKYFDINLTYRYKICMRKKLSHLMKKVIKLSKWGDIPCSYIERLSMV